MQGAEMSWLKPRGDHDRRGDPLLLLAVAANLAVLLLMAVQAEPARLGLGGTAVAGLAVLGLLSAAFLAAGTVALFGIRRRLAQRPRLFSRTLEELARDRRELES